MRIVISFLSLISLLLVCNIIAYSMSEDYRFFVKKLKYREEVVETQEIIDDSERYILTTKEDDTGEVIVGAEEIDDEVFFLDVLKRDTQQEESQSTFPEMFRAEEFVLERFREKFILSEREENQQLLF